MNVSSPVQVANGSLSVDSGASPIFAGLTTTGDATIEGNATVNDVIKTNNIAPLPLSATVTIQGQLAVEPGRVTFVDYLEPSTQNSTTVTVESNLEVAANTTVNYQLVLPRAAPILTALQLIAEIYGYTNHDWQPYHSPRYDGVAEFTPSNVNLLSFNDASGKNSNLFIVNSLNDEAKDLLCLDSGFIVKKDIHAGGMLGCDQGAILLGHGLTYWNEPPKISLTHSDAVWGSGAQLPNLNLVAGQLFYLTAQYQGYSAGYYYYGSDSAWHVGSGTQCPSSPSPADHQQFIRTDSSPSRLYEYYAGNWTNLGSIQNWNGGYDTLHIVRADGLTPANLDVQDLTVHGNLTVNGQSNIGGSLIASLPLQLISGALSILQCSSTQHGYLTSTDWNTFNGKISQYTSPTLTGLSLTGNLTLIGGAFIAPDNDNQSGIGTSTNMLQYVWSRSLNIGKKNAGNVSMSIDNSGLILNFNTTSSTGGIVPDYDNPNTTKTMALGSTTNKWHDIFCINLTTNNLSAGTGGTIVLQTPINFNGQNVSGLSGLQVNGTMNVTGQAAANNFWINGSWLNSSSTLYIGGASGAAVTMYMNGNVNPNGDNTWGLGGGGSAWQGIVVNNLYAGGSVGYITAQNDLHLATAHLVNNNQDFVFDKYRGNGKFWWRYNYNPGDVSSYFELMNLDNSGTLTIAGDIYIGGLRLYNDGGYMRSGASLITNGTMTVSSNGGTGAGSALYFDSNRRITQGSSIRALKTNIKSLDDASWIYSLRPVTFDWENSKDAQVFGRQIGLIAEEVQPYEPLLTFNDDQTGELRGVLYEKLAVPMLVEMQKLKREVDELKAKLAAT